MVSRSFFPSSTSAISHNLIGEPFRGSLAIFKLRMSSIDLNLPASRMMTCSCSFSILPVGKSRLAELTACTTWSMVSPLVSSACRLTCTFISRSCPPIIRTSPTPCTLENVGFYLIIDNVEKLNGRGIGSCGLMQLLEIHQKQIL